MAPSIDEETAEIEETDATSATTPVDTASAYPIGPPRSEASAAGAASSADESQSAPAQRDVGEPPDSWVVSCEDLGYDIPSVIAEDVHESVAHRGSRPASSGGECLCSSTFSEKTSSPPCSFEKDSAMVVTPADAKRKPVPSTLSDSSGTREISLPRRSRSVPCAVEKPPTIVSLHEDVPKE